MVGRVPLFPLFLTVNSTPHNPTQVQQAQGLMESPQWAAPTQPAENGRRVSNVYEANPWLWQFGCGKQRLGGLTVVETAERMVKQ
jgi:hypothetical protein